MQTLKSFEFVATARQSSYDWAKILDGGIHQLTEGEDYTCKRANFCLMAKKKAKALMLNVVINRVEGGLVLQASPAGEDHKVAKVAKVTKTK